MSMSEKQCSKCKKLFPNNVFSSGRSWCADCCNTYQSEYYSKNRERINARCAAYYVANKEKFIERRNKNKAKNAEYNKKYRAENKQKIFVLQSNYRAKNRERIAAHKASAYLSSQKLPGIYCLSTEGGIKVGRSKLDCERRAAAQLAPNMVIEWTIHCNNPVELERLMHDYMGKNFRIFRGEWFFKSDIGPEKLKQVAVGFAESIKQL